MWARAHPGCPTRRCGYRRRQTRHRRAAGANRPRSNGCNRGGARARGRETAWRSGHDRRAQPSGRCSGSPVTGACDASRTWSAMTTSNRSGSASRQISKSGKSTDRCGHCRRTSSNACSSPETLPRPCRTWLLRETFRRHRSGPREANCGNHIRARGAWLCADWCALIRRSAHTRAHRAVIPLARSDPLLPGRPRRTVSAPRPLF